MIAMQRNLWWGSNGIRDLENHLFTFILRLTTLLIHWVSLTLRVQHHSGPKFLTNLPASFRRNYAPSTLHFPLWNLNVNVVAHFQKNQSAIQACLL